MGLTQEAWSFFSSSDNFGKFFSHLPKVPEGVEFAHIKIKGGELPQGHVPGSKTMHLGNSANHPGFDHTAQREGLAIYLERFAHFFRREFFVRKAFETLNTEAKLEHMGFRKAVETLYSHYQAEVLENAGEITLVEHVYDEYFLELDVERVERFFAWLDVVRPVEAQ